MPNLWRVLTWDGRISELFQWPDAGDKRDVRAVLESEGVTFDSEGRADQDLRVPPTEMQELLDWMEEAPEGGAA